MAIIEEINKQEELRKKFERIRSLWDVKLPKGYGLDFNEGECILYYKAFMERIKIADVDIEEDIIIINFKDEEDYKKLRLYFADSKTKFKLFVNGYYY